MNNVCISLWLKTFYFLNRPLKVILLAKRTLTFLKLLKHISKLLKITQWKEQDTSIYIPQMPFVKFCLLSQQKKKGFLFLFAFLYSVRLNSFFIQSFALKNIHILCEFFSIFFFFGLPGSFFVTILFHQLCQYVNTVHIHNSHIVFHIWSFTWL